MLTKSSKNKLLIIGSMIKTHIFSILYALKSILGLMIWIYLLTVNSKENNAWRSGIIEDDPALEFCGFFKIIHKMLFLKEYKKCQESAQ